MIRLTAGNQFLIDLWRRGRDKQAVPHLNASMFIRDINVGKNTLLQFKAPDGSVRVAHAGGNVESLIGIDLTGVVVSNIYSGSEREELSDMQRAKFLHPFIIHSHSNTTTLAGEMIQLEMLQLPFINQATDEVIYVIGAFEWTHANSKSNLGGGLKDRTLLSRSTLDVKTLKPFDSEFTIPHVAGAKKLAPVAAAQVGKPEDTTSADRIEL
ncbi:MAG: PAS domain-containing protein [Candidatus Phaeomarinobacter sp.]